MEFNGLLELFEALEKVQSNDWGPMCRDPFHDFINKFSICIIIHEL